MIDTDQPAYTSSLRGWPVSERPWLGGSYPSGDGSTWMPDVWTRLRREHYFETMIDIGCGYGHALEWFQHQAVLAVGVEADHAAIVGNRCREHVYIHDYTDGPFLTCRPFGLAWSAEFVQQVEERFLPNFMATFACCFYACITHGVPGQPGHHHVNNQDDHYWVRVFDRYGFDHVPAVTDWMRKTDTWHAPWGRRSLLFFKNRIDLWMPSQPISKRA